MLRRGPTRTVVLAASIVGHGAVLALLAASRGTIADVAAPPAIIQVQIAPAYLPTVSPPPKPQPAKQRRPSPLAPSPRPPRRPAEDAPIAPLIAPLAPPGGAAPTGLEPGVREALRASALGCANPDALKLDSRARARCLERLGDGAREVPFIRAPLSKSKQAEFDKAAARKEADRKYREAPIPPGLSTSDAPGGVTGLGQTGHGSVPFP